MAETQEFLNPLDLVVMTFLGGLNQLFRRRPDKL